MCAEESLTDDMVTRPAVILINMPFAGIQFPSIQLGLLQGLANAASIDCRALYANVAFARRIGIELYNVLSNHRGTMIGEWIFSLAAFGDQVADYSDSFPAQFPKAFAEVEDKTGISAGALRHLREVVAPVFVTEVANDITALAPPVVGFTSTFEQNTASIALARAIKARAQNIATLFGGANFDGPMGPAYMKAAPSIDACVIGEADHVFVPVVQAMLSGSAPPALPGVLTRERLAKVETVGRASYTASMDALPTPLYDDYFDALTTYGLSDRELGRPIFLPFESSRGCWWGEKHHCTFCGLNALGMEFRTKSTEKVVQELAYLTQRYSINRFTSVDNILSPKLMNGLTERLAGGEYDYEFFYEIKANLTRDKVRQLYNSGIRHVQPGIESLSTPVLKLMRKGITALQNVNALRWMSYYGLEVLWNIIHGFPGETQADYEHQLRIIERITHLAPPNGVGRIWLERFSPIYQEGAKFGFADIRPERSYAYVYPPSLDLEKASYFFEGHSPATVPDTAMEPTRAAVEQWRRMWKGDVLPFLTYVKTHAGVHISDGRDHPDDPLRVTYRAPADAIYLYCSEQPCAPHAIARHLRESHGIALEEFELQPILDRFVARGFMLREDHLYLSLALPAYRRA
jgi:ribosomal peptide maturation radical SAM protein 1